MPKSTTSISKKQIVLFLSGIDLFSSLSSEIIHEIADCFEVVYLPGNSTLMTQGEASDCMYLLMFGFLRAVQIDKQGTATTIGELSAGNVVGEIGCLFDEPRTASIYTIRDSVLLKMARVTFSGLLEKHPRIMMGIVRQSVKRLVNPEKYSPLRDMSCFCILPAGKCAEVDIFSHAFVEELSKYGETKLITKDVINSLDANVLTSSALESAHNLSLFQMLESKFRFLVYVATENDVWAKRCIRQSDKILLLAQYGENPELGEIERFLFNERHAIRPTIELVLQFSSRVKKPHDIANWLEKRHLSAHHKVRQPYGKDLERLVRLETGHALGVVLSGGGSCALSHVGVIRALTEARIPIDYIGGTSMGSLVGGLYAQEVDCQTMEDMLIKDLSTFQDKLDYTLPVVALIKAKILDKLLGEAVGQTTRIEDLWQHYFSVSANISSNELHVHETGLLWQGIRASLALPGIFPAVFDKQKDIFVDGGILNNLPVDIMVSRINGGKTLASSISIHENPPLMLAHSEYTSSGWHLFLKYVLLPKLSKRFKNRQNTLVTITSIIQDSMIVGSTKHQREMIKLADYNIIMDMSQFDRTSFSDMQQIIASGYQQAMTALETMDLNT